MRARGLAAQQAEAAIGELTQNRNDGFGVMPIRRRDIDRQRDAVFLNGHLDLDAADLLAAIDAARKTTRRRATGATVDDHGARFWGIAAGAPPGAAQPIEQPTPVSRCRKWGPPQSPWVFLNLCWCRTGSVA